MFRHVIALSLVLVAARAFGLASDDKAQEKPAVPASLNFTMNDIHGQPVNLAKYQGKVVLMVNVASQCGYTPQYKALEGLHQKYKDKGLAILGFPANDFGQQEPGSDSEIKEFCSKNYGVTFDMFSKVVVKGEGQCPLYKYLTSVENNPAGPGDLKWNFEKFLIGRDGRIIQRFRSKIAPDSEEMVKAIEAALEAKPSAENEPATRPTTRPATSR